MKFSRNDHATIHKKTKDMRFCMEIIMQEIQNFRLNTIYYFDVFVNRNIMKYFHKMYQIVSRSGNSKVIQFSQKTALSTRYVFNTILHTCGVGFVLASIL